MKEIPISISNTVTSNIVIKCTNNKYCSIYHCIYDASSYESQRIIVQIFSERNLLPYSERSARFALWRSAVAIVTNLLKCIAILHKHPYRKAYYNPGDEEGWHYFSIRVIESNRRIDIIPRAMFMLIFNYYLIYVELFKFHCVFAFKRN